MRSAIKLNHIFSTAAGLLHAGGLSLFTASVTLLVVSVSAIGADPSDFKTYNLGYFMGTFIGMLLYPQFSFFVLQFGVSERERLQMLLVSGLIVFGGMITGVILWITELGGMLGLGLFSGLVLNSALYLNTELFSSALRRQILGDYFRIRVLAIVVPFVAWVAVIGFSKRHIVALLAFEFARGAVFFLSFAIAVSILMQNVGRARPSVQASVIKAMVSRHVIKVFEAVLVVLFPFFIMSHLDTDIAPIRIGFQVGMTLSGVVGIVLVPRVLRMARFDGSAAILIHFTTLIVTVLGGALTYLWSHTNTLSYLPYLVAAALAVFLPVLCINGALALRLRGARVAAMVWALAVGTAVSLHLGNAERMVPFLVGLVLVHLGYSLSILLPARIKN